MSTMVRVLAVAVCAAYPVLNHIAAARAEPRWSALGLALVIWMLALGSTRALAATLIFAVSLAVALAAAAWAPAVLLYAPSVSINLGLCMFFAATLSPDKEPLVSRFARSTRGGQLPPDLVRYTRCLTVLWAVFFALMAAISLTLAITGPVSTWSLFANLLNYLLVGLFFVVEYVYRRLRFRHHPHLSPSQMIRLLRDYKAVMRSDLRS